MLVGAVSVTVFGVVGPPGEASATRQERGRRAVEEGSYIVVYRSSVNRPLAKTNALEEAQDFEADLGYKHALGGFAAELTPGQVGELNDHPDVAFVAPDRVVRASAPLASGESVPTGVRRIESGSSQSARSSSSANVAVIDTGIDLAHPDLNAADGVNCVGTGPAQDENGHGTHVAGTIAAKNNGLGVTGVAPGTKVYSAKVLDASGSGTLSGLICGIDWVTSTRTDSDPSNDIAVANLSLGATGDPVRSCATTLDPLHRAICSSHAAGITYVVAAGNDGWDYDYAPAPDVPAAYPEVLTVTAMGDGNGLGGGGSTPSCDTSQRDDSYALFSNFATTAASKEHTIAAPGSCILSTVPGGRYATMSGTSMASPHVAGAVALCLSEGGLTGPCNGMTPSQIISKMRSDAAARTSAVSSYGFSGDPLRPAGSRYYGYLTWAGWDATPPSVTSVTPADGSTGQSQTTSVSITFNEPMDKASTQTAFSVTKTLDGAPVQGSFSWSTNTMRFVPWASLASGTQYTVAVGASARDAAGNPIDQAKSWTFKTISNVVATPSSTFVESGLWRSGSHVELASDDARYYEVNSTTRSTYTSAWQGRFTGVTNSLRTLRLAYKGKASRSCSQNLSLWRWTTSSWVQFDARSVGTSPVLIDKTVSGTPADYVSGTSADGEVRVRVRCTTTSGSFVSSGDGMRITYTAP